MTTKRKKATDDAGAWLEAQYQQDPGMEARVDALVAEMALEQELVALRESVGISQRALAQRLRISQPAVAKLESGRVKNVGVQTITRYVAALGGRVQITIVKPRVRQGQVTIAKPRDRQGRITIVKPRGGRIGAAVTRTVWERPGKKKSTKERL